MKKSKLIYIVFCHLLVVGAIFFGASCAKAQNFVNNTDEFQVKFNITFDKMDVERNDIVLTIHNLTNNRETNMFVSNSFSIFFKYDRTYSIEITCLGYNTKILGLLTDCPRNNYNITCNFNLESNKPDHYIGLLAYNKDTDMFKTYKTP
jgi:hypothetical protein